MKKTTIPFALFALSFFLVDKTPAADFSKAQQTIVPPSYIRRDLDALGTNNWSFPGLNTNSPTANPNNGINSILGGANNSGANNGATGGAGGSGVRASRAADVVAPASRWGTLRDAASQYNDIPGLSTQLNKLQSRISSLLQQGKYGDAENLARAGLKYFPTSSVLKSQFASATVAESQAYLTAQNYDSAGKKAREALVADPGNNKAKIVIGKILRSQGLDPNSAPVHATVGDSLAADGRLLEASVEYKTALDIKPNAAAHVGLGNLAIGKGEMTDAQRHFEQALAIDPNNALAYRQRGALRYVTQDPVGASSDFSKSVSLAPNDQLAANALVGLWKQQVSNDPNSINGHMGLARAYMQTNNLEGARNEYKAVVAIDPNNPALPAARNSFKIALSKLEANQCVQAAHTLEGQGATQEACQKVSEAVSYAPNDPQILLYHAQLCEKMGFNQQAHDSYMAILQADPKNQEAAQKLKTLSQKGGLQASEKSWALPPTTAPESTSLRPRIPTPTPAAGAPAGLGQPDFTAAPHFNMPNGFSPNTFAPNNVMPPNAPKPDFTTVPHFNMPNNFNPNNLSPNNAMPNNVLPQNNLAPNNMPAPNTSAPDNNGSDGILNAPLKSPLGYKPTSDIDMAEMEPQCVYSAYPDEVGMLSSFAYSMRSLMVLGQQAFQLNSSSTHRGGQVNTVLSSNQADYF